MIKFSDEEKSIMAMYETKDRVELVINLKEAIPYIEDDGLKKTATGIVSKLVAMTDKEFAEVV